MSKGQIRKLGTSTLLVDALWDRTPEAWEMEGSYAAFKKEALVDINEVLEEHSSFEEALAVLIKKRGCMEHEPPMYGATS